MYNNTEDHLIQKDVDVMDDWRKAMIACYSALFLLGFFNLIVLYAIPATKSLRTVSSIQIFNLCLAGFLYCGGLFTVITTMYEAEWIFGPAACKLNFWVEATVKHASICFITLASFERYLSVCHSAIRNKYWTLRNAFIISAAAWIFSVGKCVLLMAQIRPDCKSNKKYMHDLLA